MKQLVCLSRRRADKQKKHQARDLGNAGRFGLRRDELTRGHAERALIFAAKLVGARIANFIGCLRSAVAFCHHEMLRLIQTLALMELQRRELRDRLEMTIKGRARHVRHFGKLINVKGFAGILANPIDGLVDAVGRAVLGKEVRERSPLRTHQEQIGELSFN